MKKQLDQVTEFHKAFNIPILGEGERISTDRLNLRKKLIREEMEELIEAHKLGNIQHIAKEACDLCYVVLGTILEIGWHETGEIGMLCEDLTKCIVTSNDTSEFEFSVNDFCKYGNSTFLDMLLLEVSAYLHGMNLSEHFERCFDEVHRSNMSKLDANGKPIYREDGKVLKSELYSPADLSFLNQ